MSKNKEIIRIPTSDALTTIDIELTYQLGGHNPWTYVNEKRGIYQIAPSAPSKSNEPERD